MSNKDSKKVKSLWIIPLTVVTRQTEFRTLLNPSEEYSKMLSELTQDTARNKLIASDVAGEARKGKGVWICGTQ